MKHPVRHRNSSFAFFVVLFICLAGHACAEDPDSLHGVLVEHKQEDTLKVRIYIAAGNAYRYSNPDSMLVLADRGLLLSEKLRYERGKAGCLVVKTLASLITGETEKGMAYCLEAIGIYQKIGDKTAIANAYYYAAAIHYNRSQYEKAIEYYLKTVAIERNTDNTDRLGDALDNIGVSYSTIGNFSQSLRYYLEALKVREKINDKDAVAASLGNIGRVYASIGDRRKALEYITRSLAVESNDPVQVVHNYENAGNVYLNISDTSRAISAFEKSVRVADSAGLATQINRILVNLAEVYVTARDYDKAYELYNRCLANTAIPNSPAVDGMIVWGMGRIHVYRKNYKEGIKELEQAVSLFREVEMKDHLTEALKNLGKAYGDVHDYEKAYKTLAQYDAYRDTLFNDESTRKTGELQYEYDLQKKQNEIELLAKDKTIARGVAEKQKAVLIGLISGLVLLLAIVMVMLRNRRRQKEAKDLIEQQAANLNELNNYKDKIFSVIAHDLRGPLGSLATTMAMLDDRVITPAQFNELKVMLDQQLNSVTLLLDNLLKWSMSHITGTALKKERLDLHALAAQNISLMQHTMEEKAITVENKVPADMVATGDAGNIDIIVRNLISNAVKFTMPGGTITIGATQADNRVSLSVADTGIGMSAAQVKKLFTATTDNSTAGTAGEKGIGLGLLMSFEFAKANNGDIVVTSTPGKGSTFTLVLPA